ncbi:MAG: hypothetical protein U0941_14545 [Planctomycetaceae bacterium]
MLKSCYLRIAMVVVLVLSGHQKAQCQDGLTPQMVELLFGDLSRPAEVLLAEVEAQVAKASLAARLQEYMTYQGGLNELRATRIDETQGLPAAKADKDQIAAKISSFEQARKNTEIQIRDLSSKLSTSWLLPVHSGVNDQKTETALRNAKVLVTLGSRAGDVLTPSKLILTSPGVSPVGFSEISPGVYVASGLVAGEYQLAWQLTPKSIVQRVPKITIPKQGCVVCEVKLGMPEPQCISKVVQAIVFPHRSTPEQRLNISVTEPTVGEGPSTKLLQPAEAPSAIVATHGLTISNSDSAKHASTASEGESPKIVAKEVLLDLPILWDEECLFSDELIGVKWHTHSGERVVFFVRRQDTGTQNAPSVLTAAVELPYQHGQLHGKVRRWAEDGTLLVEVPYRNGLMDGESRFFNRKGKLLGTSTLVKGTGTYRIWDRTKNEPVLVKEVDYVDGQEPRKP